MELDDINAGLAVKDAAEKNAMKEIETIDHIDMTKSGAVEAIDVVAEKRLVRKLDLW